MVKNYNKKGQKLPLFGVGSLYSPKETVERAKSRLGEDKYNLAFNNCEHFALWCKTGLKESSQIEDV